MNPIELPIADISRRDLCVARVPLFRGLTHEQQLEVAALARRTRLERGVRADRGDGSQLIVVHTGSVKIARADAAGKERILRVLGPGDFMGESALLTGSRSPHIATALDDGAACVFRHADLARLVDAHPTIGLRMLQTVSRRLEAAEARLAAAISGGVGSRLAAYLLSLEGEPVPEGLRVELPLPKKDVASLLGITPESLSRQLRRLRDSSVIGDERGRALTIADVDALLELAGELDR